MTLNKIIYISLCILIITVIILGCLLKNTKKELESTIQKLSVAEKNIITLKQDKDRLVEYNITKDKEIAAIKDKYKDRLNGYYIATTDSEIPKDDCGDVKPSKELLNYLRKNK